VAARSNAEARSNAPPQQSLVEHFETKPAQLPPELHLEYAMGGVFTRLLLSVATPAEPTRNATRTARTKFIETQVTRVYLCD
jgi:hypothetical protein